MINRLILNLSQTAKTPAVVSEGAIDSTEYSDVQEMQFASDSVLGNIGAPVRVDLDTAHSLSSHESEGQKTMGEMQSETSYTGKGKGRQHFV